MRLAPKGQKQTRPWQGKLSLSPKGQKPVVRLSSTLQSMKQKKHKFVLEVNTFSTRSQSELSILTLFASRKPDGLELRLHKRKPK